MGILRLRRSRGYTYVELLLVVTVASVLTALAMPTGLTLHRVWKEQQLKRSLAQVRRAIDAYHEDWEHGCIESENEWGWPETIEELNIDKELGDAPHCQPPEAQAPPSSEPGANGMPVATPRDRRDEEKPTRKYLKRIPEDPFNPRGEEWDSAGWKVRAYDDEPDANSWGGDGVYDIYSGSDLAALDGSLYAEW